MRDAEGSRRSGQPGNKAPRRQHVADCQRVVLVPARFQIALLAQAGILVVGIEVRHPEADIRGDLGIALAAGDVEDAPGLVGRFVAILGGDEHEDLVGQFAVDQVQPGRVQFGAVGGVGRRRDHRILRDLLGLPQPARTFAKRHLDAQPRRRMLHRAAAGRARDRRRRHLGVGVGFLGDHRPSEGQPAIAHKGQQIVRGDIKLHQPPGRPVAFLLEGAVIILRRIAALGAGKDMHHQDVGLIEDRHHLKKTDVVQTLHIADERIFGGDFGHLVLKQFLFQRDEQFGLVVQKFRLDPAFRIDPDLAVGLPHPIVAHPDPLLPTGIGAVGGGPGFKPHPAALDKGLDRAMRLHDARGRHLRLHLHINQEMVVKVCGRSKFRTLGQQEGHQRIALAATDRVGDLGQCGQPDRIVMPRLQRDAQACGLGRADAGLAQRHRISRGQRQLAQIGQCGGEPFPCRGGAPGGQVGHRKAEMGIQRIQFGAVAPGQQRQPVQPIGPRRHGPRQQQRQRIAQRDIGGAVGRVGGRRPDREQRHRTDQTFPIRLRDRGMARVMGQRIKPRPAKIGAMGQHPVKIRRQQRQRRRQGQKLVQQPQRAGLIGEGSGTDRGRHRRIARGVDQGVVGQNLRQQRRLRAGLDQPGMGQHGGNQIGLLPECGREHLGQGFGLGAGVQMGGDVRQQPLGHGLPRSFQRSRGRGGHRRLRRGQRRGVEGPAQQCRQRRRSIRVGRRDPSRIIHPQHRGCTRLAQIGQPKQRLADRGAQFVRRHPGIKGRSGGGKGGLACGLKISQDLGDPVVGNGLYRQIGAGMVQHPADVGDLHHAVAGNLHPVDEIKHRGRPGERIDACPIDHGQQISRRQLQPRHQPRGAIQPAEIGKVQPIVGQARAQAFEAVGRQLQDRGQRLGQCRQRACPGGHRLGAQALGHGSQKRLVKKGAVMERQRRRAGHLLMRDAAETGDKLVHRQPDPLRKGCKLRQRHKFRAIQRHAADCGIAQRRVKGDIAPAGRALQAQEAVHPVQQRQIKPRHLFLGQIAAQIEMADEMAVVRVDEAQLQQSVKSRTIKARLFKEGRDHGHARHHLSRRDGPDRGLPRRRRRRRVDQCPQRLGQAQPLRRDGQRRGAGRG